MHPVGGDVVGGGYTCIGARSIRQILYLPLNFSMNPELL